VAVHRSTCGASALAFGRDAVEFYTQEKVVIERWPKEWTRKF